MQAVRKVLEGLRVFVLVTEEGRDVRNSGATKALRAGQHTVRPMVEERGVSISGALKALKGRPTTALLMVEGDAVAIREAARRQLVASRGFASSTVEGRGVRWKDALVVQRGRSGCVSLMAVDVVANTPVVPRAPKEAQCTAKAMAVGRDAYLLDARKVQRGARLSAKLTVGENDAFLMVAGFVLKVYTEALISALLMAVERDVLFQAAPRVLGGAPIAVSDTEEESVARSRTAKRAPKVARTSARLTEGESVAAGEKENARNSQGGEAASVPLTAAWFKEGRRTKEA